jgi:tetratricopeptide (TPR) repeat protein
MRFFWPMLIGVTLTGFGPATFAQSSANTDHIIHEDLQAGEQLLQERKLDEAFRQFSAVLSIDAKNAEAQANLGVIEFLRANCKSATLDFEKALQLSPKLWNVEALLGFCELRLGENGEGQRHLEQAFPKLSDSKLRVQAGLFLIQLYRQIGNVERATATIIRLQKLDGENVDVQYAGYRLYSDLADQAITAVSMVHPDSARMRQIIAQRFVEGGNLQAAIKAYREALQIDPHLTGAHFELGEALLHNPSAVPAQSAEARKELEAALADDPNDAEAECLLGELLLKSSHEKDAEEHFYRALSLQPRNPDAHLGVGKIYLSSKEFEKALIEFQTVTATDPSNSQAHYLLSRAYFRLGRVNEANRELAIFRTLSASKKQLEDAFGRMRSNGSSDDQGPIDSASQ